MLLTVFIFAAILGYVFAYLLLLVPESCLYASTSGVMRLRHAKYRFCSTVFELVFSPLEFIDLLLRKSFWIQSERTSLEKENPDIAPQLKSIERIGNLGGLVIWDGDSVSVSFHETDLADDELSVFEQFVPVDWLTLSDTGISNAALKHLKKLSRLEHLDIDGTKVTDEGVAWLKAVLPDCNIYRGK